MTYSIVFFFHFRFISVLHLSSMVSVSDGKVIWTSNAWTESAVWNLMKKLQRWKMQSSESKSRPTTEG